MHAFVRYHLPFAKRETHECFVSALEPPDRHHAAAASGWLDLGSPAEARGELARISATHLDHPEVLDLRWQVEAAVKAWPVALTIARQLIQVDPKRVTGWIGQAYALHELGQTREAYDQLQPMEKTFPLVSTIPYNLACYACQLGKQEEACQHLARAFQIGGKETLRKTALADRDLQPLWPRIRSM
jgi:predicted Zn-dependent protease